MREREGEGGSEGEGEAKEGMEEDIITEMGRREKKKVGIEKLRFLH